MRTTFVAAPAGPRSGSPPSTESSAAEPPRLITTAIAVARRRFFAPIGACQSADQEVTRRLNRPRQRPAPISKYLGLIVFHGPAPSAYGSLTDRVRSRILRRG